MICTANDLQAWKEFPKGLRVLLLDEDSDSAAEIKSKLEQMDYIVSTFCDVNGALLTVSNKLEKFHVAIVEVNTANNNAVFKFLETAKELPTIMTSNLHCLNTMMKCIALGAVEFLQKPLSDDKLRNLWQHVVQKAFSAKENVNSGSPNPVEEPLTTEMKNHALLEMENASVGSEQYPAPSTPQLKRGGCKLFVDGDCQDQLNCSSEKDCADNDEECKSVETTCSNPVATVSCPGAMSERSGEAVTKQKDNSADSQKNDSNMSVHLPKMETVSSFVHDAENSTKASSERKTSRRKLKVDWTPELHKKFVWAVQQLGIDQAIPSRILELMKVEGLTRHNVASHLQKYRMHRRHILPKDDDGRWQQHTRDTTKRVNYYQQQRPIMAFPPYFSPHYAFPTAHQVYPVVWGHPGSLPTDLHAWSCTPGYPAWQPTETWQHWNPYSGTQADAWGCPVMPLRPLPSSTFPHNSHGFQNVDAMDDGCGTPLSCLDLHPAEDVIDNVVREVISKPKLPLPLGLKSPSTEAVLAELSKQGISTVPCCLNATNSHLRGTP